DGTITLGSYGSVYVTGMTVEEARNTITAFLEKELESPEVSVSVYAYNSKYYYVVIQGTGIGDRCIRMPITGNETVLDAMAQIEGLSPTSSKRIWIARPAEDGALPQMLQVDWDAVCQRADPRTNYQLMPNDRLFVAEDKWYAVSAQMDKVIAPIERMFGFMMLGSSTGRSIVFFKRNTYNNW
ncbi:MAG: polysaccharide biosynthesis/export family protein, partial [Planctomycetia bacterium]|nr:polysaccharide biosynthesis/export family protein [Planctomycetia bacterium]